MHPSDLRGQPGLRRAALDALLKAQPRTVLEALQVPDVGRKTTARLLALGLVTDPEGMQRRSASLAPDIQPYPERHRILGDLARLGAIELRDPR